MPWHTASLSLSIGAVSVLVMTLPVRGLSGAQGWGLVEQGRQRQARAEGDNRKQIVGTSLDRRPIHWMLLLQLQQIGHCGSYNSAAGRADEP
jgi:hypothetical protein